MNKEYITLLNRHSCKVGAEIGVLGGVTSVNLLKNTQIEKLYCVDPWISYNEYPDYTGEGVLTDYRELFLKNTDLYKNRIEVLVMYSSEAAKLIPDKSLDFVFIDANHTYPYVKQDIELWMPKVKLSGIVSGHDYGFPRTSKKYGVTMAVKEAFKNFKLIGSVWYAIKENQEEVG